MEKSMMIISKQEYDELLLSKKMIDNIFEDCAARDWSNGKASFYLDRDLLQFLFPVRYREAVERAEKEYKEAHKENV